MTKTRTKIETKPKEQPAEEKPTTLVDESEAPDEIDRRERDAALSHAEPAAEDAGGEDAEAIARSHELTAEDESRPAEAERAPELTPELRFELQWATVHAGMPDPPDLPEEPDAVIVCTYHRTDGLRMVMPSTEKTLAGVGIDLEELANIHRQEQYGAD